MCPPLIAAVPALFSAVGAGTAVAAAGTTAVAATGITASTVLSALSIAGAGASFLAQRSAAKSSLEALATQQESERTEARAKTEEELGTTIRAQREARARATVAAGESGAMGASFIASINQSIQDQDADVAIAAQNLAASQRATEDRAATARAGIRRPSALEGGLQIATAGISGFRSGLEISKLRDGVG